MFMRSLVPWVVLFDFFALGEDFVKFVLEFIETRARNDHGVSATVGGFRDFEETPALVLAEFDNEVFSLDGEFAGRDGLFHMNLG
jgi:hypothetical protein